MAQPGDIEPLARAAADEAALDDLGELRDYITQDRAAP
jgi:hypothetical protein